MTLPTAIIINFAWKRESELTHWCWIPGGGGFVSCLRWGQLGGLRAPGFSSVRDALFSLFLRSSFGLRRWLRNDSIVQNKPIRGSLGGSVVKNPPCNVGDAGLIPGQGTKIPHATGHLSPHATTIEASVLWALSLQQREAQGPQQRPRTAKIKEPNKQN